MNSTPIAQVLDTDPVQPFELIAKSPEYVDERIVTEPIEMAPLVVFVSVVVCGELVVLCVTVPKARVVGLIVTDPPPVQLVFGMGVGPGIVE